MQGKLRDRLVFNEFIEQHSDMDAATFATCDMPAFTDFMRSGRDPFNHTFYVTQYTLRARDGVGNVYVYVPRRCTWLEFDESAATRQEECKHEESAT